MDTGWVVIGKGVELLVKGGYHLGHRTNTARASLAVGRVMNVQRPLERRCTLTSESRISLYSD